MDDIRNEVRTTGRAREPVEERERASIERFLDEFEHLEINQFDEQAPVHVTVSAVIVSRRGIVLHRHRILGTWVAPGGHVDPGERPADAVVREATEETGLVVTHPAIGPTVIHVDVHEGPHGHLHLDLRYLVDGGNDDPSPPPDESQEVDWFGWDEALSITEPCMSGIVRVLAAERT